MTVLTCGCNNLAGGTYERDASEAAQSDWFHEDRCKVHGTLEVDSGFDGEFMAKVEPIDLADVKSAYLLAFGLLGYSWCSTPRLDRLRSALGSGSQVDPADALVTCGLASDAFPERSVVAVRAPIPMILVVGPSRAVTVVLPSAHTPDVRLASQAASGHRVSAVAHPWPLTVRQTAVDLELLEQFVKPERAWDTGMTFHLDRCERPHPELVEAGRELTRRLNSPGGAE